MDLEVRHGVQEPQWLTILCLQLRSCQTTNDVADVVDALDQEPLFHGQIGDVLYQLQTVTQYKHLQELLLASEYQHPPLGCHEGGAQTGTALFQKAAGRVSSQNGY